MSDEARLREDICRFARSLFERGLTPGSSGSISARLDGEGWLVTPANALLGFLDPARLAKLNAQGRLVEGDPPTEALPLHAAFYESRRGTNAVAHLHSTYAVAVTMLPEIDARAVLPPMTPHFLMKCGSPALLPYYRPGDPAAAHAIRALAGRYSTVMLANRGPVVAGESLEATVSAFEELEETCKLYLLLRGLNPRCLSPNQVRDLVANFGLNDINRDHMGGQGR